ncbi:HAD family hydrolase [Saccharobesus litoralis]|uniref:HAD family hydrolase n=1 Tax=Saccharobesus litoralis TaxID=2172099 RepID=A0A2S0VP30_9ALTE|nr:HAD-IA family hydrolase [Saccharobesus litoralis]AWB65959.1 HAD family hydrolase [Saccharobesus litoralis]
MKYKVVLFDWDGTLMDSIAKIVNAVQVAAELNQVVVPSVDKAKSIIGLSLETAVEVLFPDSTLAVQQQIGADYSRTYNNSQVASPLFADALDCLTQLKDAGAVLGVATGKRRRGLNKVLDSSGTRHFFSASRCADETASKPDPQMLNEILAELDVRASECVYIGDTVHDLAMAQAINMDRIGVTHGVDDFDALNKHKPVLIADNLTGIVNYILQP